MAVKYTKVGPGTLTVGEIGTSVDFSCQVTECVLTAEKDQEDNINTLCGDTLAGDITYTWSLTGELVQDLSPEGVNKFCFENAGEEFPFSFSPSNASGPELSGVVILDPLDIGGAANTKATAEFEFSVVGKPVWTDQEIEP